MTPLPAQRCFAASEFNLEPCVHKIPVSTDRRGEIPAGQSRLFEVPALNGHANKLSGMYRRTYIRSAQNYPEAIPLTDEPNHALDCLDALTNDPDIHLSMPFEPGDIQFVYNHTVMHDRTRYQDWPEADRRRHLLRVWVSLPNDRELPPVYAQRYGQLTVGDRGGILTPSATLCVPIEP